MKKNKGLFILGTDTDVGKTFITSIIAGLLFNINNNAAVLKPIASGAKLNVNNQPFSEDAHELLRFTKQPLQNEHIVNPICLTGEFSPKIAATKSNITINPINVLKNISNTVKTHDYTIIEGAGGITTPITQNYRFDHLVYDSKLPCLLVCDSRLGSINRVILSVSHLKQLKIPIIGIIINNQSNTDQELLESNISEIKYYTQLPIFATLPPCKNKNNVNETLNWASKYINIKEILDFL